MTAPQLLDFARDVIARAATRGRAVSGAEVVAAARRLHYRLARRPTFEAGAGGNVVFAQTIATGANTSATVRVCVLFPTTAYGIPRVVNC